VVIGNPDVLLVVSVVADAIVDESVDATADDVSVAVEVIIPEDVVSDPVIDDETGKPVSVVEDVTTSDVVVEITDSVED
jgi:hypothetical protein